MRFFAARAPEPLTRIAAARGVEKPGPLAAADAVQRLIAQLELPQHIATYGLSGADLEEAVRPVASDALAAAELLAILRAAY